VLKVFTLIIKSISALLVKVWEACALNVFVNVIKELKMAYIDGYVDLTPGLLEHSYLDLYTHGGSICYPSGLDSPIYNEVMEWLELEFEEYVDGFDKDKFKKYCLELEK
jgi:hypothetical protein